MPRPLKRGRNGAPHVLMTADAVGGVWTYALDLAHGLAAHGMRATLAVLGPPPDEAQRAAARAVPDLDLVVTGEPLDWMAAGARATDQTARYLSEIARRVGADVVHLMSPLLAAHDRFAVPVVVTCHSCVSTWWQAVRGPEPLPDAFRWQRLTAQAGLAKATVVTVPTRAFAAALQAIHGPIPRLVVVPNGRRAPPCKPASAPPDVPRPFALAVGRLWDKGKGIAALDAAAARLHVPVIAAGPTHGPNGETLQPKAIRAIGPRSSAEVAALLALEPIFVSPALYEPFGLAVLEAAQARCPLVLSDIATFRELWHGAALFVPVRDSAAIARAITDLAGDPGLRRMLALAASRRARSYSADLMTRRMAALLSEAAGSDRTPPQAMNPRMERALA